MVLLYDPTTPRAPEPARVATLAGKVVGFVDNAKPNFNHLVDDLAGLLVAGGPGTHSVYIPCFGNTRAVTREIPD